MKVSVFTDYESLSGFVADEMNNQLLAKPNAVICVASGNSPKRCCELFTEKVKNNGTDISQFFFVGLDEWGGLGPATPGSCHYDFITRLFEPLQLPSSQYHVFNGLADDLQQECVLMDKIIAEKNGIDLMIVGIGMNGHIGFNEPGVDLNLLSHVIDLDETTKTVGQKYFTEKMELRKGITLGLGHLLNAKKVLLMANGSAKAEVIKKAAEGEVSSSFPASIMQQHPNGWLVVDEAAASLLTSVRP
ncbi:MAG: glucosamine-6-phosphate deaminase [Chitinophagaceae bacterium]|nr:glucosamine-6-phosphate deaminase [Chitinophagaceae bacterium]